MANLSSIGDIQKESMADEVGSMIKLGIFLTLAAFCALVLFNNAYAENANVRIALEYPNGDRASLGNSVLVISSEDKEVSKEIAGKAESANFEVTLPAGKRYQMTVFVNEMWSAVHYVKLNSDQTITITIPTSAGMKFEIYYNNGQTPIENANVQLFSHEENLIREGLTDMGGKTLRFWLASTPQEDNFYQPRIQIAESLVYEYEPIRVDSGSTDIEIVTPWPSSVDFLKISAYENEVSKLREWDDAYLAELIDLKGNSKISRFNRGDVLFTDLLVGEYDLLVRQESSDVILENTTVTVSQKTNRLDLIIPQTEYNEKVDKIQETKLSAKPETSDMPLEGFDKDHGWSKQSSSGTQITESENTRTSMSLVTDGTKKPVFTRSPLLGTVDVSNRMVEMSLWVNHPSKLTELWLFATSDNFESSWYTAKLDAESLVPNQWNKIKIQLDTSEKTGEPDPTKINRLQIRVRDDGTSSVKITIDEIRVLQKQSDTTDAIYGSKSSCNCVAFRMDDIQDFWLNQVQLEIMNTFQEKNADLTVGIIGNSFGKDRTIKNYIMENKGNDGFLELANHGWDHEDFTQYNSVAQEFLLSKTNSKINDMFGITPTVFIPPFNSFNSETIHAMKKLGMTHFSSELDFSEPPYPLSGQNVYNFPETAFTGALNEDRTQFVGLHHSDTMRQIDSSLSEYGFAVVTIHPQDFAVYHQESYRNEADQLQIEQLDSLISNLLDSGVSIVPISEINTESEKGDIPSWIKNNAKWWYEGKVTTESFVNSLEFLIKQGIVTLPPTENNSNEITKVPDWIKTNAKWWAEGKISDSEFVSSTQFLVRNGIIQI